MDCGKIIINKCDDSMLWYSNKIGEQLDIVKELSNVYLCREDAGYVNIVKKTDATFLKQ